MKTRGETLQDWLAAIHSRLALVSDTAALDTQVLLAHVLGRSRSWVLAHPDASLTEAQSLALQDSILRLENGEPLPYLLGHWEFYGLDFTITPHTLVPRPETELLVEHALAWLREHPSRRMALDVGAGSGCIAIALAVNIPDLQVVASDTYRPALEVAQANAHRHQVEDRLRFVQSDLLSAIPGSYDLLCANLPYIPTNALKILRVAYHEPPLALDGGPDGLGLVRRFLESAPAALKPGGLALLEIEASQGDQVRRIAGQAFPQAGVEIFADLAGHDRLLKIQA